MDEIKAMESSTDHENKYDEMSLMDSFLKETARLNPTMTGISYAGLNCRVLILLSDHATKGDCAIHFC
jgi:hypothetical protein